MPPRIQFVSYDCEDHVIQANDHSDGSFIENLSVVLRTVINDVHTEQDTEYTSVPFLFGQEPIGYEKHGQNSDTGEEIIRLGCGAAQNKQYEEEKYEHHYCWNEKQDLFHRNNRLFNFNFPLSIFNYPIPTYPVSSMSHWPCSDRIQSISAARSSLVSSGAGWPMGDAVTA